MQYSSMSIHFLWIAYILVFVAQLAFGVWVASRWRRTSRELARVRRKTQQDR